MKSHANDLLMLAGCIYRDAVAKCTACKLDERDLITLRSRVKAEGISFLTITLPTLGSDLERSLSLGYLEPKCFRSFKKYLKAPAFLRGFFAQIFNTSTGGLHDEPSIEAIEAVRQIAYSFKKLGLPCSSERTQEAVRGFIKCEADLSEPLLEEDVIYFTNVSRCLWGKVFADQPIRLADAIPKHGPGATAEKISGNQKFVVGRWHDRLEPYFPLLHNAFSNESVYASREFEGVTIVDEEHEQPVRVITVPKTLKSPRIIAIEPVCTQSAQQSLMKVLVNALESSKLTGGHVNFHDQTINQDLALSASRKGVIATLDLSNASNLVPRKEALLMFDSVPDFRDAIDACRSKRAALPSGDVIDLKMFAAMGSALCFPVEAMYFYTICIAALLKHRDLPVTWPNICLVGRDVYVYGDDLIVPAHSAEVVIETLHKYYCKVNSAKSHWTGRFRESCGMDAYSGCEVTPTYIRQVMPDNKQAVNSLISWVKSANLFKHRGYDETSTLMFNACQTILGKLPDISPESGLLGIETEIGSHSMQRYNIALQTPEFYGWVPKAVKKPDRLNGYGALHKCLLKLETSPCLANLRLTGPQASSSIVKSKMIRDWARGIKIEDTSDAQHLLQSARHGAVTLKRRWTRPY